MDTQLLQVNLAHYMYIPTDDEQIAKRIWGHLVQKYNLSGFNIEEYITGITGPTYEFPILVRGDGTAVGLSVERSIITISIFYFSAVATLTETLAELETTRASLQEEVDYLIGETTVLVTDKDKASAIEAVAPFDQSGKYDAQTRDGILSYILTGEKERRYYRLEHTGSPDLTNVLAKELPLMDMLVLKLAKQSIYFKDQHALLIGKKAEIDTGVSDVLHTWAGAKSSSVQNIKRLEEDTEKLSLMYAELASSLKVIKNANDAITRDIDRLESLVSGLFVNFEESRDFRDTLLAEFKNLQSLLSSGDEVLHRTLNDIRATIEVVRTRIELERSRESFLLQQEGISVQVAAGFIELFIVGFYTLETWHLLAGEEVFEHIQASIRLGLDILFAVSAVAATHYIAKYLRKERGRVGMTISALGIVTSAALMVIVTRLAAG